MFVVGKGLLVGFQELLIPCENHSHGVRFVGHENPLCAVCDIFVSRYPLPNGWVLVLAHGELLFCCEYLGGVDFFVMGRLWFQRCSGRNLFCLRFGFLNDFRRLRFREDIAE